MVIPPLFLQRREPEPCKGQEPIEHQQFVAEVIVPEVLCGGVEGIAEQGRCDADKGHQCVVGLATGEESEGEEPQQRTVGIAGDGIDGVDERRGVQGAEEKDEEHEEETHRDMRLLTEPLVACLTADIHAVARGE